MELIGKTIGRYRVVAKVGHGGMGDVYKAYQESLERTVAIKILPAALGRDETFRARFEREARSVAQLQHPNILNIYDYGEQDGLTYLVMEYARGGTLKDRITEPLPLEEVARIVGQVGAALAYAHKRGVIHRDVKPSNVLLTEDGRPLLADFGLAKMMEGSTELTASGMSVGTPEYMSPEQGQGMPVDHRADLYSLGVVLYEMVTGHKPYTADTPMAVIIKHMTETLPSPRLLRPDLPAAIERVIVRALAKAPGDRYASAEEMVAALDRALRRAKAGLAEEADEKLPESVVQPLIEKKPRRRKGCLIWALLLLLILLVGGGALAWNRVPGLPDAVASLLGAVMPTPTDTVAPPVTPTPTVSPTASDTPPPTLTFTPAPTATPIVIVVTATPSDTPPPTLTPTLAPSDTPPPTATPLPTSTSTPPPTATRPPKPSPTATPTRPPARPAFNVEYLGCQPHVFGLGSVKGQVFDRQGKVIRGAQVEIWIDGARWNDPANPAKTNEDGWYEWVLGLNQKVRFVALYVGGRQVTLSPQNFEVLTQANCFQQVNFRQK